MKSSYFAAKEQASRNASRETSRRVSPENSSAEEEGRDQVSSLLPSPTLQNLEEAAARLAADNQVGMQSQLGVGNQLGGGHAHRHSTISTISERNEPESDRVPKSSPSSSGNRRVA